MLASASLRPGGCGSTNAAAPTIWMGRVQDRITSKIYGIRLCFIEQAVTAGKESNTTAVLWNLINVSDRHQMHRLRVNVCTGTGGIRQSR